MATEDPHDRVIGDCPPDPGAAELSELMYLNERYRDHRISWRLRAERQVRYLAFAKTLRVRPHTIITSDLAELREELERTPSQELIRPLLCRTQPETAFGVSMPVARISADPSPG